MSGSPLSDPQAPMFRCAQFCGLGRRSRTGMVIPLCASLHRNPDSGSEVPVVSAPDRRTHHQVTFTVLAAGVGAYALLQSLITPVLTTVQAELHTSQDSATWALTAYLLSASVFTPIMGRIGDMKGKKRVFVLTLVAL